MSMTSLLPPLALLLDRGAAGPSRLARQMSRHWLRGQGLPGTGLQGLCRSTAGRGLLRGIEHLAIPALLAHFAWRKRWIAARLREHLPSDGQLVILGAGLDALGLEVARRMPRCRVFEIDREQVMTAKWQGLASVRTVPGNWHPIAMDLRDAWPAGVGPGGLSEHPGWRPSATTCVVAEGVLMYLPAQDVLALSRAVQQATGGPLHLLATAMALRADGLPGFHSQRRWVEPLMRRIGEPFEWGLAREALDHALARAGWTGVRHAADDPAGVADPSPGEHVFVASALRQVHVPADHGSVRPDGA